MQNLPEFRNEAYTDFSVPAHRKAMESALEKVRAQFGREYELRLNSECLFTDEKLQSVNPSNAAQVVGIHQKATAELARRAVESAHAYFPTWAATPVKRRVRLLLRAAEILRERKME